MTDLIKVTQQNGKQLVSARELYQFLELDSAKWSRWSLGNIKNDSFFIENEDYTRLDIMSNHQKTTDYAITLDMAKELSMLSRTEKGKKARRYFIDFEKKASILLANLPKTLPEALRQLADVEEAKIEAELQLTKSYQKQYSQQLQLDHFWDKSDQADLYRR